MKKIAIIYFTLIIFLSGCATVSGPGVSSEEIYQAREQLRVKALDYQLKQLGRVSQIGYDLVLSLPPNQSKKTYPYSGLVVGEINRYMQSLFDLDQGRGLVVVAVLDDSPAKMAGLGKGDVITAVNGRVFRDNIVEFLNYIGQAPVHKPLNLTIDRKAKKMELALIPKPVPIDVHFQMVDMPEVNAAATANNYILYTYGMVKFTESDDEIAVVLGHELAHLVRGHVLKMQSTQVLNTLLSLVLGVAAESQAPGSGSAVSQGVQQASQLFSTKYSRDLENEADYFGIQYVFNAGYNPEAGEKVWERFAIEIPDSMVSNFLATHPSSPERMVRIQKIIQELRSEKEQQPKAKNKDKEG